MILIILMIPTILMIDNTNNTKNTSCFRFRRFPSRAWANLEPSRWYAHLHSAKGGAVETGCSDLYDVMY